MKFYSKRGNCIVIENSKIINEIFYDITNKNVDEVKENYIFVLQEDKVLQKIDDETILSMNVDIVPNAKRKRMPYNFKDFFALYNCLKREKTIPYIGEDVVKK